MDDRFGRLDHPAPEPMIERLEPIIVRPNRLTSQWVALDDPFEESIDSIQSIQSILESTEPIACCGMFSSDCKVV